VRVRGSEGARQRGCTAARVLGSEGARQRGCTAVRVRTVLVGVHISVSIVHVIWQRWTSCEMCEL
jgi:hypothetical protein